MSSAKKRNNEEEIEYPEIFNNRKQGLPSWTEPEQELCLLPACSFSLVCSY